VVVLSRGGLDFVWAMNGHGHGEFDSRHNKTEQHKHEDEKKKKPQYNTHECTHTKAQTNTYDAWWNGETVKVKT
jgi:hypothetical protein